MDTLLQDLRFALRSFRRNLQFTVTILLSLGIGLGASCAFYSVIHAVVVQPMYRDVSRILVPTFAEPDSDGRRPVFWYTLADYLLLQGKLHTFSGVIATRPHTAVLNRAEPRNVNIMAVSPNFFDFFGTRAVLGRTFTSRDIPRPGTPPALAVIGYKLWQREFDGSSAVLGSWLTFPGSSSQTFQVIGVMPKSFTWFNTDVFAPLPMRPNSDAYVSLYFKRGKEATPAAADAELQSVTEVLSKNDPAHHAKLPFRMHGEPFQDWVLGKLPGQLMILMGAVTMLLAIACGNISILMLARSETRRQEIAMRSSLGATRWRIARQLLTETLLLSLGGCAVGVLFARTALPGLLAALPEGRLPQEAAIKLSWPVLAFAIAVSVVSGICIGLVPIFWLGSEVSKRGMQSGQRITSRGRFRIHPQTILVAAEVALGAMLLVGCVVAVRRLTDLQHVRLGYNPDHVAVLSVNVSNDRQLDWAKRRDYYERIERELIETPGVQAVAETLNAIPPVIEFGSKFTIHGAPDRERSARVGLVSSDYFRTLETPVVAGRVFDAQEVREAASKVVINMALARTIKAQGQEPVGTVIEMKPFQADEKQAPPKQSSAWQVIGVVATIENQNLEQTSEPAIYLPYTDLLYRGITFLVRTKADPRASETTFQKRLRPLVDADEPLAEFDTLEHLVKTSSLAGAESSALLFSLFAWTAVVLACFGVFSVVTFGVAQRRKEIGIRRALGAQSEQIAALVVRWIAGAAGVGIVLGLVATFAFGKVLAYYEQGWQTKDPMTLISVPVMLVAMIGIAIVPAILRALSTQPDEALKAEP